MLKPSLFILYVDNPLKSAAFYSELFDQTPIQSTDTFVMYAFSQGWKLGLWSKHDVIPAPEAISQGVEVAISLSSKEEVDAQYRQLQQQTVQIIQPPSSLDFGYAFTALDPDGHRLRFYFRPN